MGTVSKASKGTVSIEDRQGKIRLRWRVQGDRYALSLGLDYSKLNLKVAESLSRQIELDILAGNFDPTLDRYRLNPTKNSEAKKKSILAPSIHHSEISTLELWDSWLDTIENPSHHYTAIGNWIRGVNPKLSDLASVLLESKPDLSAYTYNQRLSYMRRCIQWGIDEGKITENPLKGIKNKRQSQQVPEDRKPFDSNEIAVIIAAFRSDRFCPVKSAFKHSHYADFVETFFILGTRPSEIIGLQVKHCNFRRGEIEISSSLVRQAYGGKGRVRKETKTGSVRYLPMTDRLREILLPRCQGKNSSDLIFTSPKGGWIDDGNFLDRQWKIVLDGLKLPYRVPYAIRHSMISRGLEQGIAPTGLAYLAGHKDSRMVIQRYGHMINRPNLPGI